MSRVSASTSRALLLVSSQEDMLDSSVRFLAHESVGALYIFFTDYLLSIPDQQLLSRIISLYDIVAEEDPQLDLVPCLSFAGWSLEFVAQLQGPLCIYGRESDQYSILQSLLLNREDCNFKEWPVQHNKRQAEAQDNAVTSTTGRLGFDRVAVGGTFDRLHAGHRILLAISALVARRSLFMGITGDELLVNKKHKELLQSYDVRSSAAEDFVRSVRPGLQVSSGPLLDPKARTMAAEDASMEALVVSQETVSGGQAINKDREEQGFPPLALVIVNLVGVGSKELGVQKLSSTGLREREAQEIEQKLKH